MTMDLAHLEGQLAQLGVTLVTAKRSQQALWVVQGFDRAGREIIAGTSRAGVVASLVAAIDSVPRGYHAPASKGDPT